MLRYIFDHHSISCSETKTHVIVNKETRYFIQCIQTDGKIKFIGFYSPYICSTRTDDEPKKMPCMLSMSCWIEETGALNTSTTQIGPQLQSEEIRLPGRPSLNTPTQSLQHILYCVISETCSQNLSHFKTFPLTVSP